MIINLTGAQKKIKAHVYFQHARLVQEQCSTLIRIISRYGSPQLLNAT